jgi:hypothetical protein
MFVAATIAAVGVRFAAEFLTLSPLPLALIVAAAFGGIYAAVALALGLPEARALVGAVRRRLRRG